jgi:hypothetical protein
MKISYFILFLTIVGQHLVAQTSNFPKYDNFWFVGENDYQGYSTFNFDSASIVGQYVGKHKIFFDKDNTSMCDKYGKLQYVSNGMQVMNPAYKIMDGGQRICPNPDADDLVENGMTAVQHSISLPRPRRDGEFVLVNQDFFYLEVPNELHIMSPKLYFQYIDMKRNNGDGKVLNPNTVLSDKPYNLSYLTAVQHGNGSDWWIPANRYNSDMYEMVLLTHDSIFVHHQEKIGRTIVQAVGQGFFTPDGSKFVRIEIYDWVKPAFIDIFDFDRCTGRFSNPKTLVLEDTISVISCGGAISANSRYLYVSYINYVFQYDLQANDIAASKDTVAIYDGFKDPKSKFDTRFFLSQLAPDGKIYMNTLPATEFLHVLEFPNEKGKACKVRQHAIKLPTSNAFTMPNFPNYRLGPLKGSPCDTLSVATKELNPASFGVKFFPNPASDRIQIDITLPYYDPATKTELVVVDLNGEIVQKYTMPDYAYLATLDVSKLASGVYGVQLRQRGKVLAVEKLVVVK